MIKHTQHTHTHTYTYTHTHISASTFSDAHTNRITLTQILTHTLA
jgi:hypothetical protein